MKSAGRPTHQITRNKIFIYDHKEKKVRKIELNPLPLLGRPMCAGLGQMGFHVFLQNGGSARYRTAMECIGLASCYHLRSNKNTQKKEEMKRKEIDGKERKSNRNSTQNMCFPEMSTIDFYSIAKCHKFTEPFQQTRSIDRSFSGIFITIDYNNKINQI